MVSKSPSRGSSSTGKKTVTNTGKKITASTLYLGAYNLVCAFGWAWVAVILVQSYQAGLSGSEYWAAVWPVISVVQSLAALEIVHSAMRLVRSPVFSTFIQVDLLTPVLRSLWGDALSLQLLFCVFLFSFCVKCKSLFVYNISYISDTYLCDPC